MSRLVSSTRLAGLGVVAALGLGAAGGRAQPPAFVPANAPAAAPGAQEADITREYAVTPQAGTWMICAASYTGPNAPTLARQLTEEIRNKHRTPAYIFNLAEDQRRKLQEDYERAWQAVAGQDVPRPRRRYVRIEEQCAVLIGGPGAGWSDIDAASSYLKKVRKWDLPELRLPNGIPAYDMKLEATRSRDKNGKMEIKEQVPVNPFHTSFVARNPTLPPAPKEQAKFDPFWKKLNAHEEYSLLKCPQPWTLAVKEYIGATAVREQTESSSFLDKIGLGGNKLGEGLSAAGQQAHYLAEFLQKLGFKAYVLHTRTSSIVTVGAFASREDPEMERTQERLARFSFKRADTGAPAGLDLFPRAMPMEVPHP
jgi:hypothetical protein